MKVKKDEGDSNLVNVYDKTTELGRVIIFVPIESEFDAILANANKEWLYEKLGSMVFGIESTIKSDPQSVYQINEILNQCLDRLIKLAKIVNEDIRENEKET